MAKRGRNDPYKGFNFQVAFAGAVAAIAGFALVKKLLPGVARKYRNPGDYVRDVPASSRPIEGVGTSVAARSVPKSKAKRPAARTGGRKATRKKGGAAKRR